MLKTIKICSRPLSIVGCLPVIGLTDDLIRYNETDFNKKFTTTVKSSFTEIPILLDLKNLNGLYSGLIYNCEDDPYELGLKDFHICAVVRKKLNEYNYYNLDLERSLNSRRSMFNYIESSKLYKLKKPDIWSKYDKDIEHAEQLFELNDKMKWYPRIKNFF